ncbi:hypothetical protein [Nonomuraea sp. B19D2]|uniref:hypothetical protein n=1 Tax=Nonomuraea sp. B19D2 TaxID=3159561 RepID=UPI0032DBECE1
MKGSRWRWTASGAWCSEGRSSSTSRPDPAIPPSSSPTCWTTRHRARSISAYRILDPDAREELMREIAALLGDGVDLTFTTDLTLARRAR